LKSGATFCKTFDLFWVCVYFFLLESSSTDAGPLELQNTGSAVLQADKKLIKIFGTRLMMQRCRKVNLKTNSDTT